MFRGKDMDKKRQEIIRKLRKTIISSGYVDIYLTYGTLHSVGTVHPILRKQYIVFPDTVKSWVNLFLLNKPCPRSFFETLFSEDELQQLCEMGIIKNQVDGRISSPLVLMPYRGYLIFFERRNPGKDIKVYMGDDSLALASHLMPPQGGRCLDLCTGSGIQALVCSSHSKVVVGVDLQKKAVEVATLNTYLNQVDHKVSIRHGNLYNAVATEQFDFICANPPLLPAPSDLKSPIVAGGGEDGLSLSHKILKGLTHHLVPGGICQILGTCLGDAKSPFVEHSLIKLSKLSNCTFNVIFPAAHPIELMVNSLAGNSTIYCGEDFQISRDAYRNLFKKLKATHIYSFFITAIREIHKEPNVHIVPQYRTTKTGFWTIIG